MHTIRKYSAALILMVVFSCFARTTQADPVNTNPAQAAINALITTANSPLPIGTKLQSINISDGLATVDFSHELRDNFHGGDTDEADAVNGILRTLGQYPTVSRVQILVAGHPVESLGGMLVISSPLDVIRPASHAQTHRMYFHRHSPAVKH